jgi:hypothetical protein
MAIKYNLQPNPVTPDPNDHSARVLSNKVHDLESITKEMLKRRQHGYRSRYTGSLKVFFGVVTDEVAEGNNVNLPLVNLRQGVTGFLLVLPIALILRDIAQKPICRQVYC